MTAGQTTATTRPDYGRFHLVGWSDLVRNSAAVPTMVGGNLTTADEVNTVLAAGRADLCLLDPRRYRPTADPGRAPGSVGGVPHR